MRYQIHVTITTSAGATTSDVINFDSAEEADSAVELFPRYHELNYHIVKLYKSNKSSCLTCDKEHPHNPCPAHLLSIHSGVACRFPVIKHRNAKWVTDVDEKLKLSDNIPAPADVAFCPDCKSWFWSLNKFIGHVSKGESL